MTVKAKILVFFLVISFGIVSLVYPKNEWNLNELSQADPSAKAWLIQVEGDSILVHSKKNANQIFQKRKEILNKPHPIYENDIIVTGVDDRATLLLRDGSVIWVNYMTFLKVSDLNVPSTVPGQSAENYKVNLKLKVGSIRVRVPKVRTIQKKFSVQTPQGTASVRGTEQVVQYSPEFGLQVQVLSGLVAIENQAKSMQYASRGEKVEVNTDAGTGTGIQTVNQQKRTEIEKNIQIASGTKPTQVQVRVDELQTIVFQSLPPQVILTPQTTPVLEPPLRSTIRNLTDYIRDRGIKLVNPNLSIALQKALTDDNLLKAIENVIRSNTKYSSDPVNWILADLEIDLLNAGIIE